MPTYVYKFLDTNETIEVQQSFTDDPLTEAAAQSSDGRAAYATLNLAGNMGETSATGVAFTRNPSTGEKELYGEFLINAQGEDVVAGIRTPQDITEKARIWPTLRTIIGTAMEPATKPTDQPVPIRPSAASENPSSAPRTDSCSPCRPPPNMSRAEPRKRA